MAATDARPIPFKNTAYRHTFPIWDADGDLVTGATGLDSEVSIDAGTFADCTNEATEIATASGIYYLDLTSAEMNGDTIAVIVKTSTVGAKTTPIVLFPQEAGDLRVNVTYWNGTAVPTENTAGYPIVTIKDGTGTGEIDTTSGGVLVAAIANNAITAAVIATDAIDSDALAASAVTEIQSGLATAAALTIIDDFLDTEVAAIITTLGTPTGASVSADIAAVQADTDNIQTRIPAVLVSGRMDASVGAMAANTLTASALATDAVTEIQSAVAAGSVASVIGDVGGNVAGNVTGSVGSVGTGGISSASFAAGAITATAIANDAIGSAELAATAVAEIADAVWDELLSGHVISGSTGEALAAAGAAGDPWTTALPGAYGAGTAGKIIGDNINATISSRSTYAGGAVSSVTGAVGSVAGNVGGNVTGSVGSLAAQAKADVNAEVVDALNVDTYAEPGSVPAATASLVTKLGWLFTLARNKRTTTSSADVVRNDADSATIGSSTISDDGTTFVRGEYS